MKNALLYEAGHKRRTEHILKVYGMTQLIAASEGISDEDLKIISAAAILHDIPIKRCKELFNDACQNNQQKLAPEMVRAMMLEAGYKDESIEPVLYLVLHHHNYNGVNSKNLRILIEADLLVNYMEDPAHVEYKKTGFIFKSACAKELLKCFICE